ncbi:1987_t:CDS:10 [Acaulospora colombiana]|uniref:1987_t:CDS:1 n=1 Tax=Acaulospora colombiana TaxID=27376 RepID=A0ACA9KA39_9GLOM|nr:1987_t:CDS:10 [Acaulospora colombiana]
MSLQGSCNFSDDGSAVIERIVENKSHKLSKSLNFEEFYEIERTVNALTTGGYETFPDELLTDSAEVAIILKNRTQKKYFILADTSYGRYFILIPLTIYHTDELKSLNLLSTSRLPVLYVFGKQLIDMDHCSTIFDGFFGNDNSQKIVIMYDVVYCHCIDEFARKLHARFNYSNIILSLVNLDPFVPRQVGDKICTETQGRHYSLPEGTSIEDFLIFYIGGESSTLSNLLLTHNKCKVYSYDPETRVGRQESLHVNRALMKRYYMVQKAKDADVIGIVVGTLGKSYTFVMGKLNISKMANFMEIDCFVLVACPENSLIDSKEFYRPIVTPFELEMSLDPSKEWTGEYTTDFRQLLLSGHNAQENSRTKAVEDMGFNDQDDVPHFSLVTGKLKKEDVVSTLEGITDLTLRDKNTSVSTVLSSAAGEFLNSRTFRGLEQNIGETEVQIAEEGRKGTAMGYSDEKEI